MPLPFNHKDTPKGDLVFSPLPEAELLEERKGLAQSFFRSLRDDICREFVAIEAEHSSDSVFERKSWEREQDGVSGVDLGGGEMSLMRGDIFEKVGVNISTVHGEFSSQFAKEIPASLDSGGRFWASGLSLVAHMRNPHVPAVHMNLRMLCTGGCWFGGAVDINGCLPDESITDSFHHALREVCDKHDKDYYEYFRGWCDDYFHLPHRGHARGQGGIFFDYLDRGDWDSDFAFVRDIGGAFLDIFPSIVRVNCGRAYGEAEYKRLLEYRGRYAEFNLLYDRGTRFGLQTGGNSEAILMSLPPMAAWD